ncbi:hypothetical protein N9N67_11720, partial [Bacteriovoracaceae bacterium]|nr:hypothetical protein [Bacteriovoracaceae bacterium]
DDGKEFIESYKTRQVLTNYCDFMPYPIQLIDLAENKKIEEENAKAEKEEDKKPIPNDVVNQAEPLWKKDPNSLTDQDYKDFYRKLFPMDQEPLFWLHLNVDHPFTLQGILYFPKLNMNKPINENSIRLYSKQVFVSDNVKNIVPDFLSLLKGAIDSSDIPLNVSRSALQGDPNVKKISNYIIKKVSEALKILFKKDRARYESVWEDIGLFVKYGCTSDTKFDEVMKERVLYKTNQGKHQTISEWVESIPENYKEKLKEKILYYDLKDSDPQLVNQLDSLGITAFGVDNYFDPNFIQHFEMGKINDVSYKFSSVEAELENLLETEESSEDDQKIQDFFQNTLAPEIEAPKTEDGQAPNPLDNNRLMVEIKKFKDSTSVAYFKVDEQMKRFAQMTKSMGQNNAFAMPVKKTLVINPNSDLIQKAFKFSQEDEKKKLATKLALHVQDLAQISSEGLKNEEKEQFVTRSQDLIQDLTGLI